MILGVLLPWLSRTLGGGISQSLPGLGGEGDRLLFNPSLFTEQPEHPGITGDLPLSLLNSFNDTGVTEQCHLADGRSCLREGERLALMLGQR